MTMIFILLFAEWSSPVARRAHNPKVIGSNPVSATSKKPDRMVTIGLLLFLSKLHILYFCRLFVAY